LECRSRAEAAPGVPLLWRHHAAEIAEALSPLELVQVAGADEAEQAAWDAAILGFGRIVAVGGPRVAHGLVNGIMRLTEGHRRRMKIGFLNLAHPGAWARTAGFPSGLARQLEVLAAGSTLPYDIGQVDCADAEGRPVKRHFLLGAACGPLGVSWSERELMPLRVGLAAAGLLGVGGRSLLGRMPRVALEVDGREVYRGPWALAMIMGGTHYPLLGQTAPDANPSDGAFDIVWIPAPNPVRLAGHTLSLWLSAQVNAKLDLPGPPRCRGSAVRIVPLDGGAAAAQAIEADGVPIGWLPAAVQVLPRTFPVIVEAIAERLRERTRAAAEMSQGVLAGSWRRVGLRREAMEHALTGVRRRRVRARRLQAWASASR
jgi:diacylglycerol kinase family enzyme